MTTTQKYPKPGEFTALQDKWRVADDAYETWKRSLRVKYGPGFDLTWAKTGEKNRLEQLHQRASRAADKVFVWLDRWSPWDWGHGTSMFWILNNVTEADALSPGPMMLPAASAGYGSPQVDRLVHRR